MGLGFFQRGQVSCGIELLELGLPAAQQRRQVGRAALVAPGQAHPLAQARIELLQALRLEFDEGERVTGPFGSRRIRLAAAAPAVVGMSLAIGNAMRQPGYTAAIPSEADRKQSADPIAELGARYLLGKTGQLLPYDEFVKERPDVSKGEYDAYKAYLFGSASPIKATLDGINGPEVTFLGKSIPVATGVLPAVAAVVGAGRGVRKAMDRLRLAKDETTGATVDRLEQAERARLLARNAERELKAPQPGEGRSAAAADAMQEEIARLKNDYITKQRNNEIEILKQSILGSSKYMVPTALAGQTLESIRRSIPQAQDFEEPDLAGVAKV
jgi:hypothetical protein